MCACTAAGIELYEGRGKKGTREQQQKRERDRQIAQFSKQQKVEDTCLYCPTSEYCLLCTLVIRVSVLPSTI